MHKWLARFSFSFFILAAVLAWDAYKRLNGPSADVNRTRLIVDCVGAGACGALGAAGVRARHRDSGSGDELLDK